MNDPRCGSFADGFKPTAEELLEYADRLLDDVSCGGVSESAAYRWGVAYSWYKQNAIVASPEQTRRQAAMQMLRELERSLNAKDGPTPKD